MERKGEQIIRVGSRKSELALIQTNHVIDCLKKVYADIQFEIVTMTTLGDRILNVALPKIGEKSLFTKDLEDALQRGSVDFVVHSLKDLPTTLPEGLAIGAVFEREDPRDALVLRDDLREHTLESLPPQSCIGTSSLRRTAQLRALYPHLRVVDVRGNLNTRLRKLQHHSGNTQNNEVDGDISAQDGSGGRGDVQEYAALILAQSGLVRMGWQEKISQVLPCSRMLYAVGQGALAVECRADNVELLRMLSPFNHAESYCRTLVERSFLKTLGGGCSAPVGVSTSLKPFHDQHKLTITGAVWSLDGTIKVDDKIEHVFPQIRNNETSSKHKLSPTISVNHKRVKTDTDKTEISNQSLSEKNCEDARSEEKIKALETVNPIEAHNQRITERSKNLNCEDTRSEEDIKALATNINPIEAYNQRITERKNPNCEDIRSKEEVMALAPNANLIEAHDERITETETYDIESKELIVSQSDIEVAALTENVSLNSPESKNEKDNSSPIAGSSKENGNSKVKLYCGMTQNLNVSTEVVEKCEQMGKDLAEMLISKGAIEVMKVSQDYIRSSIKK